MSRYIDADKLKEKLHSGDKYLSMLPLEIANLQREFVREVEGYIDDTPTEKVKPIEREEEE